MKLIILLLFFSVTAGASEIKFDVNRVQDLRHSIKGISALDLLKDPALAVKDGIVIIDLKKPTLIEEVILENGEVVNIFEAKVVGGDGDSGGN